MGKHTTSGGTNTRHPCRFRLPWFQKSPRCMGKQDTGYFAMTANSSLVDNTCNFFCNEEPAWKLTQKVKNNECDVLKEPTQVSRDPYSEVMTSFADSVADWTRRRFKCVIHKANLPMRGSALFAPYTHGDVWSVSQGQSANDTRNQDVSHCSVDVDHRVVYQRRVSD
jgi:hypothetical protein